MGQRHARVLGQLAHRFEVVGVHDVRRDVETPAGVERLRSEADAIARAEVVVVATPIETHAGIVARALAAGRHVLVEKPLCASTAEARILADASRGSARLFVGHSERFNPVVRVLARLVRDEEILAMDLRRVGPSSPRGWGVLVNMGVHDFDLAAYLGGGDVVLRGALGGGPGAGVGEDVAHVLFSTARGAIGHLCADRTVPTNQRSLVLTTSRWIYEGDLLAHRLSRTPRTAGAGGARWDVPLPLDEPLATQATALADALDGGEAREIATGADGARAVELAEQAAAHCTGAPTEKLSVDVRR
jgi:predicted dehydrogenase